MIGTKTYGPSGMFCWIATEMMLNSPGVKTLTIVYYSITWMTILLNCIFVIKVILLLREELKNEQELIDKYTSKLRWYPIIQIISYIPATVNRIYGLSTGRENFWLMLFQNTFDSLTGVMFALVYGLNASVKNTVRDSLRGLCGRKVKQRKESTISDDRNENTLTDIPNRLSKSLTFLDESFNDN